MYSTEEIKEILEGKKLINGECWVNIREADHKKIKKFIHDKEELSLQQICDLVKISDEDILRIEEINLKIMSDNITKKDAFDQKAAVRKDVIYIYVKHKKGTNRFCITLVQDFFHNEIL
jgi:hypothetical protein